MVSWVCRFWNCRCRYDKVFHLLCPIDTVAISVCLASHKTPARKQEKSETFGRNEKKLYASSIEPSGNVWQKTQYVCREAGESHSVGWQLLNSSSRTATQPCAALDRRSPAVIEHLSYFCSESLFDSLSGIVCVNWAVRYRLSLSVIMNQAKFTILP